MSEVISLVGKKHVLLNVPIDVHLMSAPEPIEAPEDDLN